MKFDLISNISPYKGAIKALCLLLLFCSQSWATDYYVNDNTLNGDTYTSTTGSNMTGAGTASNPYATISHVINVIGLSSGDNIYIDAGTYNQTDIQLIINTPNIQFIGAGSGYTVFDNSGSGGTQEYFMRINANNVSLTGMTITGYDYEPGGWGKGVTVQGATGVVLNDVNTVNNKDNGDAAIMILSNSEATILNCTSSCNQTNYGGGIQIQGGNITVLIDNCVIANNYKSINAWGGGILIDGNNGLSSNVNVTIQNSSINDNIAVRGAGISVSEATLTINNSCFDGNSKVQTYDSGGAIYIYHEATVTLNQCSFTNNTASASASDGGAIGVYGGDINVNVNQCYFSGNSCADDGNAIFVDSYSGTATVTVNESIFDTGQNYFKKSDGVLVITNSGNFQPDSGTSGLNAGSNSTAQSLGMPPLSCATNTDPCAISALPVEFIDFNAVCLGNNTLELYWSTATEMNNESFIISGISSGSEWRELTRIPGKGNSQLLTEYTHHLTANSAEYLKISQRDIDGTTTDLKIITAPENCTDISYAEAYFDEQSQSIVVRLHEKSNSELSIQIINSMGQEIQKSSNNQDEQLRILIPIKKDVVSGIYYLAISGGSTPLLKKVRISR